MQVILSAVIAEGDKAAELAEQTQGVLSTPALNAAPNTGHAQALAKSCVINIHLVLFHSTTSALTASNNHNAIYFVQGEQDTKGLFVGGLWILSG